MSWHSASTPTWVKCEKCCKAIEQYKDKEALGEARNFLASAKDVGGLKVITANLGAVQVPELRKMGDFLRDKQPNVVAVLTAINGEKISFLAVCGKEGGQSRRQGWRRH